MKNYSCVEFINVFNLMILKYIRHSEPQSGENTGEITTY